MISISLLNEKGGIGRTTTALHLASGFALKGKRVLFIDTDPQGSATVYLGLERSPAIYDLMVRKGNWKDCIVGVDPAVYVPEGEAVSGSLFAVRSNVETRNIGNSIVNASILAIRLAEIQDYFDYVIIDTSPTPSLLHNSIVIASNYVLFPTMLESMSAITGLPDTVVHTEATRNEAMQYQIDVGKFLGVIPTMYQKNTVSHGTVLTHLLETYGKDRVFSPIGRRIVYSESSLVNKMVYTYDPMGSATREMKRLVGRVERGVYEQQAK